MRGNDVIIKEYNKQTELELGLKVRNSIFPGINVDAWERGEPQTAVIAFSGDEAIGFIPLSLRKFKLAPGVIITAAFENAVGVKKEFRGESIGTMMLSEAACFLKSRVDVLLVYRDDERSKGYKFYKHTGHTDLNYMRCFTCDVLTGNLDRNVLITAGVEELENDCDQFMQIFEESYCAYGGFPVRTHDYWCRNIKKRAHGAIPVDFLSFKLMEGNSVTSYIIAGEVQKPKEEDGVRKLEIFEMAAKGCDEMRMKVLLEAVCSFAGREGFSKIEIMTNDQSPFVCILNCLNFKPGLRLMQMMALNFDAEALFKKLWSKKIEIPGVEIRLRTPERDMLLSKHMGETLKTVILEMKDETFLNWIMGRVDFKSRVREGSITLVNGNERIVELLSNAIPLSNWVYHDIDYI